MALHEKFRFRSLGGLLGKIRELGLDIPLGGDAAPLFAGLHVARRDLPNRFAVLPMEGADADPGGAPTALTFRRYRRYAAGGSAVIWFEAAAVHPAGRSNPRQLMITSENADGFRRLTEETRKAAEEVWGRKNSRLLVLQLTHAGRFSRPDGEPAPIVVHHSPFLDPLHDLHPDYPEESDEELDRLQDDFIAAAELAAGAGFDGVDVKACHGYLISELLASHTREDSRYGGSYENRTRFLREIVRRIHEDIPELLVTSRLNAFDMIPFPFGFGMDPENPSAPDLREVKRLIADLRKTGLQLLLYSLGVPAWKPHFGRPFDEPAPGGSIPGEHPLEGVARHLRVARELQRSFPDLPVVGAGYSWLRQYFPSVASAVLSAGGAGLIGLGRGALAYPGFVKDLAEKGKLDGRKVCTTCSLCSMLLRKGGPAGCPIRDGKVYKA